MINTNLQDNNTPGQINCNRVVLLVVQYGSSVQTLNQKIVNGCPQLYIFKLCTFCSKWKGSAL